MSTQTAQKIDHPPPANAPTQTLPTMYDLPSEDQEEPGLPDDFHYHQPQLLRETFVPPAWPPEQFYVAADINLYYDPLDTLRYKRPDWFAVLDVPRLYQERDLRLSYVTWQEKHVPLIVVELLSPGTEKEDLGQTLRDAERPPNKWEVYEQILRIPYYVIFSRYTDELRAFELVRTRYREVELPEDKLWLPEAELGLGLWQGEYLGLTRKWLRWYGADGNWIPTPVERKDAEKAQEYQRAEQERQRAEQEHQRAERLAEQLGKLGIEPEA